VRQLIELGTTAAQSGFDLLATSDHFQPWQANEGHSGEAWVTMGAMAAHIGKAWMGTTVTCPILRYHPSVVAETFATLSQLHPGRVFLGVGSGEALNEEAAIGCWPGWEERWDRLIEALAVIRALWSGAPVSHRGRHYQVSGRLYDPPSEPIPILTAANGRKSMRLAGQHGDGLITDPATWRKFGAEWRQAACDAGKNPDEMPVLVEQFVVVGDADDARRPAALWHFLPKAFKGYHNIPDPAAIERHAEAELTIEQIVAEWTIGPDPDDHIAAVNRLFDSGATIVNIHSGQIDQQKVIDFYGNWVLPEIAGRRQAGR
jgi:TAT-translocated FGD2 family F420-dependent dehydrogenase